MTGAPIPKGADSVVMVEDTEKVSGLGPQASGKKEYVRIFREVKKGENARYAGEDVRKGEAVIRKGDILKSGYIGMLASLGVSKIKVYRKPKAAILATGDELVEINQRLVPGKIRNSNAYSLYSQVIRAGAFPILLGIARDEKEDLRSKIKKGLKADMLLVSGGISVGDYDFVKDVLGELGTQMKFWRVAMKPGKPLAFGMMGKISVFGLPGNPVSSMVTFEQFVRPALLKMAGAREIFRFHLPAIFREDFQKKKGLRYFLRVVLENKNGTLYASLTGPQGSGILKSMVLANGIMELPEELENLRPGDTAQVTYLD
jgi:molybdopterin molybdotransferase